MTACGRAGLKYLEQNSKKEGVVTTSSGLQYKVC
jgi:FKBP-type peptidyl-prolyl cis-trans isomerase